jgi:hypothetical protein
MVAVINIVQGCHHMLEARAMSNMTFVFVIRDVAAQLSATLVVAFFFFLLQWYVLWRMDRLQS